MQTGQYDTPTEDMYAECQELLQLFGLPYIIAPGEVRRHQRHLHDLYECLWYCILQQLGLSVTRSASVDHQLLCACLEWCLRQSSQKEKLRSVPPACAI